MHVYLSILLACSVLLHATCFAADNDPYPTTYRTNSFPTTAIINATLLTAAGPLLERGSILMSQGRIAAIGKAIDIPPDAHVVDATGKWVTPGIIDAHSHLGVFPSPGVPSNRDGNEKTGNNTAHVWVEHAVWPQDAGFELARRGGVTTVAVLPGSTNLIGGRSVTLKNVPAVTVQAMKFPGASHGVKMACGENPVATYGAKGNTPFTRMGNIAGFRDAWIEAQTYAAKWTKYRTEIERGNSEASLPDRDLKLETLAGVLAGDIQTHIHCYRADEMAQMIDLSKEFGFRITAFHHAVEAYKIAELLAAEGIAVATWANRWGFKLEAYDGIEANAGILHTTGVDTIVHSDSSRIVQRLNVHAAIALAAARRAGLDISRSEAIEWITANPAKALNISEETGTLEVGKMADVVVWSGDPFSIYSLTEQVYIDGARVFDRNDPVDEPGSDLLLGQLTFRR